MRLILATPPATEPLSVADARALLGIASTDLSDAALSGLIAAARQSLDGRDGWLNRAIITQQWDAALDRFPTPGRCFDAWSAFATPRGQAIKLPLPPLQSVDAITYTDEQGATQTLDSAAYTFEKCEPALVFPVYGTDWPYGRLGDIGTIKIRFTAGYGDGPDDVPDVIKTAIAMQVGFLRSMSRDAALKREIVEGVGEFDYGLAQGAQAVVSGTAQMMLASYRIAALG